MALTLYLCLLAASCAYALVDWRRAWFLVVICGVLQDPVRKLTPGTPVVISFSVVVLYAALLFAARQTLIAHAVEFGKRFGRLQTALAVVAALFALAAVNGIWTFGIANWEAPLVSLFTYSIPVVAAVFGYAWLQREEWMYRFFHIYAAVTAVAMIGTVLEYFRVPSRIIGLVAFEGEWIRHLPGIQIRLLSGFYRSPDVMAWHAATLTAIGIGLAFRAGVRRDMLMWSAVAAWGFFNCMIAGRRKAIYFVVVFCVVLVWRYFRRINSAQLIAMIAIVASLAGVIRHLAADEDTSVYALAAAASQDEIAQRLEGGVMETIRQFGIMGAGLGSATQGVHHLLGRKNLGWQEGGLGKLAIEVGVPGLFSLLVTSLIVLRLLLRLTRIGDVPGSTQFLRVMLFALVAANAAGFAASAQAYTDAVLALTTGFFIGCLFATATLDERLATSAPAVVDARRLTSPAPA